jgi:hypothetical protein
MELAQDDLHGNGKELTTEQATSPELPAGFVVCRRRRARPNALSRFSCKPERLK